MTQAAVTLEAPAVEHEIKLVTPALRAPVIAAWLRARCLPDPRYPRGLISSIYFDNRDMLALRAKVNSDFLKRKVRVRWYRNADDGLLLEPAYVEIKRKVGSRRFKAREPLHGVTDLLARQHPDGAQLRRLLRTLRRAGHLVEPDLQPFLRISFRRLRFVEPDSGARVALDTGIVGESMNPGWLPHRDPRPLAHAVIEVKGPFEDLPRRLAELRDIDCRRESFSKFARCYQRLTRRSSF